MSGNLWCFAWTKRDEKHESNLAVTAGIPLDAPLLCESTLSMTRSAVWDDILKAWFNKVENQNLYVRSTRRAVSRAAAIAYLKRRGGRVLKVRVVPA